MDARVEIVRYEDSQPVDRVSVPLGGFCSGYGVDVGSRQMGDHITIEVRSEMGASDFGIDFVVEWPDVDDAFVVVPGAAYDGNRFAVLDATYPPIYPCESLDEEPVITDLPRVGRLHLLAGDATYPAVGIHCSKTAKAWALLFPVATELGQIGMLAEDPTTVRVQLPGVRWNGRYAMARTGAPCSDRGASVPAGFAATVEIALVEEPAVSRAGLFRLLDKHRHLVVPKGAKRAVRSLSATAEIVRQDYSQFRWREDPGFFATADSEHGLEFQVGWVGGGMGTLALLECDDKVLKERAAREIDFICARLQAPSGFFYGAWSRGRIENDGFGHPHANDWGMVRKSGDMLLFLVRQILSCPHRPEWRTAARRCADAFARLWHSSGQWGQFVELESGRLAIAGSACGGTAIAGLALSSTLMGNTPYLTVACAAAERYAERAVKVGVLNGGPGEILKAPDSESAFGLLEGFVTLWEVTGKSTWLELAEETAYQAASWVVPYDFLFPPESTFGRMGIGTAGSVIANVQNKHSAPGICTGSPLPLLKLFRATGQRRWLELACEIASALPQYVSSVERPIRSNDGRNLPPGWINERVNMSDWEVPTCGPGEVFYGSCWCASTVLLTAMEMPGVYVQPETGLVACADAVSAKMENGALTIENPTQFAASVRILVDRDPARPLGELWWRGAPLVSVPPMSSTTQRL